MTNHKEKGIFYFSNFTKESGTRLSISIAKFLDRLDVVPWRNADGSFITIQTFNALNPEGIAEDYLNRVLKVRSISMLKQLGLKFSSSLTWEQFKKEVARYIDFKLPVHLWAHLLKGQKKYAKKNLGELRRTYLGIDKITGVEFTYRENYIMELRFLELKRRVKKRKEIERKREELVKLAKHQGYTLKHKYHREEVLNELISAFRNYSLNEKQTAMYLNREEKPLIAYVQ